MLIANNNRTASVNRRHFLGLMISGALAAGSPCSALAGVSAPDYPMSVDREDPARDYLYKMRHYNESFVDDVVLGEKNRRILRDLVARLERLQRTVGYGNFYLLGFDDARRFARNYSRVGDFTADEETFLERLFYEDAGKYGFFGSKPLESLTADIPRREVSKIPRTGNYLYRGKPERIYKVLREQVGDDVVLTSGVRSVMKQFLLFLKKADKHDGNLSLASRSLAPPGYSFHGIGDFDVGKRGFGVANFTERFTETDVFQRLEELGYVRLRYPRNNMLGVRFEPWHIKISVL